MNQKKAKALRRLARECSVGLPDTEYVGDKARQESRRRRGYVPYTLQESGPRRLLPASTRAVYRELKNRLVADERNPD